MNQHRLAVGIAFGVLLGCVRLQAAGEPPLRDRLLSLAADARSLASEGRESTRAHAVVDRFSSGSGRFEDPAKTRKFPIQRDLVRYGIQRPWIWRYDVRFHNDATRFTTNAPAWPAKNLAAELRKLTSDPSPDVRSLAAEALAAYLEPGDVPAIAALLTDDTDAPPALRWNSIMVSYPVGLDESAGNGDNAIALWKEWQNRKVSDYAKFGLRLMTGEDLNRENFAGWWKSNQDAKTRVWYWRERLQCELGEIAAQPLRDTEKLARSKDFDAFWRARLQDQSRRNSEAISRVALELREQTPEVEAKIRLCAVNHYSTGLGMDLDTPLMGPFTSTRLSSDRLIELMERKNLWEDVDWSSSGPSGWRADLMAREIALSADKFFNRSHVEQLRRIAQQDPALRGALAIGISRILPPASPSNLDDGDSADGVLRAAIRGEKDTFQRSAHVTELASIGFQRNWALLESQFFADPGEHAYEVRQSIIRALTTPPLEDWKRKFLGQLLLDERYELLWVRTAERPGSDIDGRLVTQAVRAYTDRTDLNQEILKAFMNRQSSAESLAAARKIMTEIFLGESARKN